jgi:hypothetical protein
MTTTPTPAPERVPDEYNNGHGISVCEADSEVGIYLWHEGMEFLPPDDADALADAIKAHAAAARLRGEES